MTREDFIASMKNLKTEDEWLAFEDECNEVLTEAEKDEIGAAAMPMIELCGFIKHRRENGILSTVHNDIMFQETFVKAIAEICDDKDFIASALTIMKTDKQRLNVLSYLRKNKNVTRSELQETMKNISAGMEYV